MAFLKTLIDTKMSRLWFSNELTFCHPIEMMNETGGPVACIWCSLNPWIKILLWRCRRFLYLTCSVLRVQVYAPRGCKPRGTARLCRKTSTNWHIILCRGSEGKWIWQMYPWEICLWSAHQEAEGERKEKEEEKGAEAEVSLIEMQTTKKKPQ